MRHVISILVQNQFGVLARIAGLFSARGYNIDSLAVGPTEDPGRSRVTIIAAGDNAILEQITKQLNKLIDVIKVSDFKGKAIIERELALIKVNAEASKRQEIFLIADVFKSKIVGLSTRSLTIEVTGPTEKVDGLIDMLRSFGIYEVTRTGTIATTRDTTTK